MCFPRNHSVVGSGSRTFPLTTKPNAATAKPGVCQFGEEWTDTRLLDKTQINHNTILLTFATPDETEPLGLSTCACILARGVDGCTPVRPYTPISTNATIGKFQLLVKVYPEGADGKGPGMSVHLSKLNVGDSVEFKHIPFNVKIQYPFSGYTSLTMLVGGTGITPMIQALHPLLANPEDNTNITILYGSREENDILGRDMLRSWSRTHDQLTVIHVLSLEPEGSNWLGQRGFIDSNLIQNRCPPPTDDHLVFVCGPPPMYKALCGPRDDKNLSGALADLNFSPDHVFKF